MPTTKQVRFHYGRIERRFDRLQEALNEAHNANVIQYDATKYADLAPCRTMTMLWERIENTTEKQLAAAMREEIRYGLRPKSR